MNRDALDAISRTKVCEIREARTLDLPDVRAIYNHYVLTSTCTYQLEPETEDQRRAWFEAHGGRWPVTVATIGGRVVGWGSLSQWSARGGYARTVESSVYIQHEHHRRGIGRALVVDLLERAKALGHHVVLAGVSADQTASIALHQQLGFKEVARLREVGFKLGRWLDVVYLQRFVGRDGA